MGFFRLISPCVKPLLCKFPAMSVKMVSTPTKPYSPGVSKRPRKMPMSKFSTCMVPLFIALQNRFFAVLSFRESAIIVLLRTA